MAQGLSVSGIVNVTVTISPIAAPQRNFGVALFLGDSNVIDVAERLRPYRTLEQVAGEFGTSAPEYRAAALYFSQNPRPSLLYLGRWARIATAAILHGGLLTNEEQDIGDWQAITDGSFRITIDGTVRTVSGLDFSGATNLNGVASIIAAALTGGGATWDALYDRFDVFSDTSGTSSTITHAVPVSPASGTDISGLLKLNAANASNPVGGIAGELPIDAVVACEDRSGEWYGVKFTASVQPSDNDLLDVSAYIEGASRSRIHAVTVTNSQALDSTITNDFGSRAKALGYKRTTYQYSSTNSFAVASMLGRAFTVNFEGTDTTITLMFKQEPGIIAETLTESQAATLKTKNYNVFVNYDNDSAILQWGVMANGYFFDEVHGLDWLQNAVQSAVWNLLYQEQRKIPQTDAGITQIRAVVSAAIQRGVRNGLVAPGVWNGPNMGALRTGNILTNGFYVFADNIANQVQSDREARKSPPIQAAVKLAGAVHTVDVIISVNR